MAKWDGKVAEEAKVQPPETDLAATSIQPHPRQLLLESEKASAYTMRAVQWFWPGRFALGKLGLIGGLPDKGKGLISADVIPARHHGGACCAGEGQAPRGNVIWFTAEDELRTRLFLASRLPAPISIAFT